MGITRAKGLSNRLKKEFPNIITQELGHESNYQGLFAEFESWKHSQSHVAVIGNVFALDRWRLVLWVLSQEPGLIAMTIKNIKPSLAIICRRAERPKYSMLNVTKEAVTDLIPLSEVLEAKFALLNWRSKEEISLVVAQIKV